MHHGQRFERLCRYLLRPPLAQDRLQLTDDGRVLMELRRPWSDGTTHLLFEGVEMLEKLAAIIPRPRVNLLLYHGLLAPRARWRKLATSYGRPQAASTGEVPETQASISAPALVSQHSEQPGSPEQSLRNKNETMNAPSSVASLPKSQSTTQGPGDSPTNGASAKEKKRYSAWSDLMRRAFALDVLACPRCGQRMRLVATIEDPAVVKKILNHLGLSTEVPEAQPARPPPG
jgi:hypothetical protein